MSFLRNVILPGRRTAVIAVVFVLGCFSGSNAFAQSATKLEIRTLSSRPDLVSGGDALVEVKAPAGTSLRSITLTLNAVDAYWDAAGKKFVETATFDGTGGFNTMYPVHSEPRLVAGAPLTNDVLKCQRTPINYVEYKATFTVAQKARMTAIFPSGVCDFSKPGVEQVPLKGTYRRY